MNFSFVHEFDIDVPGYWQIFLSKEFNDELYRELKMRRHEILEQTDDGKHFHRVVKAEPSVNIPSFLQSIVKETGYTEIDDLDWASNSMRVVIETAMFKDRFSMSGSYTVAPIEGGNRVRREFRGEVKVAMPLVGGKIEKFMMENLRDAYDVTAEVTRRWIKRGPIANP